MSDTTKIQWADATFNPWIGCTKVSPGCLNCYAEKTTRARVLRKRGQETWGKGAQRSRTSAATWKQPVRWNEKSTVCDLCGFVQPIHNFRCLQCDGPYPRSQRVFPSLCDWLDDEVPIEWLADFLKLIYDTPNIDWLLLTKRPENFHARLRRAWEHHYKLGKLDVALWLDRWSMESADSKPPNNVWIGTSVEDQTRADERIPALLKIPAKVRFLSCEPLLGPLALDAINWPKDGPDDDCDVKVNCLTGESWVLNSDSPSAYDNDMPKIDWVIPGGESGTNARPCNVAWIRSIVEQCKAAGVAPFVKQLGQNPYDGLQGWKMLDKSPTATESHRAEMGRLTFKDKKGGDMAEWPEDLRVREFPCLEQKGTK